MTPEERRRFKEYMAIPAAEKLNHAYELKMFLTKLTPAKNRDIRDKLKEKGF